jgi:hypothetical protein
VVQAAHVADQHDRGAVRLEQRDGAALGRQQVVRGRRRLLRLRLLLRRGLLRGGLLLLRLLRVGRDAGGGGARARVGGRPLPLL